MKPLSEVAPGLLVIQIPIQAVCKNYKIFSAWSFFHMAAKYQKVGDVFCFIFLNQFLTDMHPVEPGNTVVSAYVGRRGKSVPGASHIAQ